jgi:hypothetical protein
VVEAPHWPVYSGGQTTKKNKKVLTGLALGWLNFGVGSANLKPTMRLTPWQNNHPSIFALKIVKSP